MRIIDYDNQKFNFDEIIAGFIGTDDLRQIKANLNEGKDQGGENSIYKNMEQTDHYEKLYACLDSDEGKQFYGLYEDFIKNVIRPTFEEAIYFQKKPTHRIHFKNSSGAARFHRDSDYGHSRAEINYSVPQTPMFGTNAIWIESEEGKADYAPMECKLGQFAEFKGSYLEHGARQNTTGQTRVSFDFRVMPESEAPDVFTDRSSWNEEDKQNPLFQNAHNFALCE